jgi:hypothetical protein
VVSGRRGVVTLRCRLLCSLHGSTNLCRAFLHLVSKNLKFNRIEAIINMQSKTVVAWWKKLGFLMQGALAVTDDIHVFERALNLTAPAFSNTAASSAEASSSTQHRKRSRSADDAAADPATLPPGDAVSGLCPKVVQAVPCVAPSDAMRHTVERAQAVLPHGTGSRGNGVADTAAATPQATAPAVDVQAASGAVEAGHAPNNAGEAGAAGCWPGSAVDWGGVKSHGRDDGEHNVKHDEAAREECSQGSAQRVHGSGAALARAVPGRSLKAQHLGSSGAVRPSQPSEEEGRARLRAKPARLDDVCVYLRNECGGKGNHVIKVPAYALLPPGFEHSFGRVPNERLRRPYKMLCTVCGDTFHTALDDAINLDLDAVRAELAQRCAAAAGSDRACLPLNR